METPVTDSTAPLPKNEARVVKTVLRRPFYWLLVALPVAAILEYAFRLGGPWVFLTSCLAIIPLAGLMGEATENLSVSLGAGLGGLLNATFGNAAELIIALAALSKGTQMFPLIKASITGSILGNILLVLGLSILLGGLKHRRQIFNRTAASMGATLLALATIGLIMPTVYYYIFRSQAGLTAAEMKNVETLSEEIAVILAAIYLLSLVFSLRTHRHLFAGEETELERQHPPEWTRRASLVVLLTSTAGVAWMSELLVGSVEPAAQSLGMNQVFVGVIVVAVIGNAAEHGTAVMMALRNKMDLAVHIAVGSGIQVALFVAPLLVLASLLMGHRPVLDLHFTAMELIALILAVVVLALVSQDGESHWMEGVMLLGVYLVMALSFYHLPAAAIVEPAPS
jgi:Ca2+:H+ antiporter